MKKNEVIGLWIQLATGVAVIIGLVLVVWELQQSRELTRLQIVSDGWSERMAMLRSHLSESFAETLAKACFHPDQLTDAEIMEVTSYNEWHFAMMDRKKEFVDLGGTRNFTWEQLARANLGVILSTRVGQADFATSGVIDPEIKAIAEAVIRDNDLSDCSKFWEASFEAIRGESDLIQQ